MATYTLKQLTEILKCSDITIRRCFKSNSDEFSVILPSNSKQGQKKYYSQAVLDLLKEKLNIDVLTEQEDTLQLLETQGGNENQCTAPLKDKEEENTVIRLLQEQVEELREQISTASRYIINDLNSKEFKKRGMGS